jgi:hypothetical protein
MNRTFLIGLSGVVVGLALGCGLGFGAGAILSPNRVVVAAPGPLTKERFRQCSVSEANAPSNIGPTTICGAEVGSAVRRDLGQTLMSAFGGKADIGWRCRDVRF